MAKLGSNPTVSGVKRLPLPTQKRFKMLVPAVAALLGLAAVTQTQLDPTLQDMHKNEQKGTSAFGGLNNEFLGPAATALARRYNLDSRDQGIKERLPVLANSEGVWECSFVGECSVVCPKGVDPAKAIQQTKLDTTMRFVLPYGNRED